MSQTIDTVVDNVVNIRKRVAGREMKRVRGETRVSMVDTRCSSQIRRVSARKSNQAANAVHTW